MGSDRRNRPSRTRTKPKPAAEGVRVGVRVRRAPAPPIHGDLGEKGHLDLSRTPISPRSTRCGSNANWTRSPGRSSPEGLLVRLVQRVLLRGRRTAVDPRGVRRRQHPLVLGLLVVIPLPHHRLPPRCRRVAWSARSLRLIAWGPLWQRPPRRMRCPTFAPSLTLCPAPTGSLGRRNRRRT